MASAVWGTLDACLSRPTLPTISAGAAKRITCQIGKFHGITASTAPMRLVVHVRPRGRRRDGLVRQQRSRALSANQRSPTAHLDTSALAAANVLPISVVRMRATSGTSPSSSSAAVIRWRARSA